MMDNTVAEYDSPVLDALLDRVYLKGGYDFREYRRSTVTRRLERRLFANGLTTYRQYMELLDSRPDEVERLVEEITIKSSGFFRTAYAFSRFFGLVLPQIYKERELRGEHPVRFWSTACACGEEPYSIAITLSRFLGEGGGRFDSRVYASDISRRREHREDF
jgi:two-component system CheB/CheR fusion protein